MIDRIFALVLVLFGCLMLAEMWSVGGNPTARQLKEMEARIDTLQTRLERAEYQLAHSK